MQKIGTNSIELEYAGGGATAAERVLYSDYLTREDEKAVDAQLPGVIYSSPVLDDARPHQFWRRRDERHAGAGVSPHYQNIRNLLVPNGRFLDDHRRQRLTSNCAVVTELFARERFGSANAAVGQTFEIYGIPFTIIGVFKESVDDIGQSEIADQTILIPLFRGALLHRNRECEPDLLFDAQHGRGARRRQADPCEIMQSRHRKDRFTRRRRSPSAGHGRKITDALTAVLVLVAAVTLAVGGVGIMNIMLANVRARIREIGIRKALGATYREIKLQFLAEAVIISLTGGLPARWWDCLCRCRSGSSPMCAAHLAVVGGHCASRRPRWWASSSAPCRPPAPRKWTPSRR
jgi:putative ABC transport system permease protein